MSDAICMHCRREFPAVKRSDIRFCMYCGASAAVDGPACDDIVKTVAPSAPLPAATSLGVLPSIPGYELVRLIGAGAMGRVYEATELETGRRVAVKCLNKRLESSDQASARFLREAQLPARISHPNVTFVYGAFERDEQLFIVMELMVGKSLEAVIQDQGKLPPERAVDLILDVAAGLEAAHRMNVIHRDVKPSNCFLHADNSVKVGDFGLSKSLVDQSSDISMHGAFMGTLAYAAPEQINGDAVDHRADIYALGATLFHLLTGRPPFLGDSLVVCSQIVKDEAQSVREFSPGVPRDLAAIVARCLAKEPERRFQSMAQLRAALAPFATYGTKLANLSRRLAAFMIDYFMIAMSFKILLFASMTTIALSARQSSNPTSMAPLVLRVTLGITILAWLATVIYFSIGDANGATWGKRLLRLRVVNRQGESPGLLRGMMRAIALPGCFGITLVWPIYQAVSLSESFDAPFQILSGFSSMFVYLIPTLLILSTMSRPNQLRGVHEIMSGTRVIGVESARLVDEAFPIYEPLIFSAKREAFGPYHSKSVLAQWGDRVVHLADDLQLHRELWVITGADRTAPGPARINLSRVSRQRWLGGGITGDGLRWDAYEAVQGVPLQVLMGSRYAVDWRLLQSALQDCAEELLAAMSDETLPADIHMGNVWIDRQGHAKILDEAFSRSLPRDQFAAPKSREENYWDLFSDVLDSVFQHPAVPFSAKLLRDEFKRMAPGRAALEWARDRLQANSSRMLVLDSEQRAGVMGVTLGFEWAAYSLFAGLAFMAAFFMLESWPIIWRFLAAVGGMSLLVGSVGYIFRGGFAFWVMQVLVCRNDGTVAPRWLAAIRNVVAWFPALYLYGLVIIGWIMLFDVIHGVNAQTLASAEGDPLDSMSLSAEILRRPFLFSYLVTSFLVGGVLLVYGLFYSVVRSPTRGLADYAMGTRLIPN